jgi:hypothetical protein
LPPELLPLAPPLDVPLPPVALGVPPLTLGLPAAPPVTPPLLTPPLAVAAPPETTVPPVLKLGLPPVLGAAGSELQPWNGSKANREIATVGGRDSLRSALSCFGMLGMLLCS